jgi:hypothetical protein
MGFYKNLLMFTLTSLIIILAILGVIMANSEVIGYETEVSSCPDYYKNTSTDACSINVDIYSATTSSCTNPSFTSDMYKIGGTGATSGLGRKKKWAQDCGVAWQGITNNNTIIASV